MVDRVGQYIDDYRLVRRLGAGAYGEVYLGEHAHDQSRVAVKMLQLMQENLKEFIKEVSTAFRLRHSHIVQLHSFGISVADTPYLIMDYAPNGTLRERHPKGTSLSLDIVLSYLQPLAAALQYAHDRRVVHRDVKPENVLIGLSGEVLLSDFGIAVVTPIERSLSTQNLGGTAPYMAPEQIRGKPQPASDQYALGIMVYEWLCGVRPFQGNQWEILEQQRSSPPPPLREKRPDLPLQIEAIILKALAKEPTARFSSVRDFATAFEQAAQEKRDTSAHSVSSPFHQKTALPLTTLPPILPVVPPSALPAPPGWSQLAFDHQVQPAQSPGAPFAISFSSQPAPAPSSTEEGVRPSARPPQSFVPPSSVVHAPFPPPPQKPASLISERDLVPTQPPSQHSASSSSGGVPIQVPPPSQSPVLTTHTGVQTPLSLLPQHRKVFARRLLFTLALVLLVALGSGSLFYFRFAPSKPSPPSPAMTTATQSTTEEHATATTHAQVQDMTATVQASVSNPYPPHSGTLALNDPLSGNTLGYQWEEGTRDQGTCTFTGGGYQSAIALAGFFHSCLALSTDFSDFTYEVRMMLISGSAGGIVFRADRATTHLYYFTVDRSGGYLLKKYYDKVGDATVIAQGSGVSFNETALIGVVAQGSTINLYVNQQLVQQMHDGTFLHGQMGVVVYQGKALFSNAKVWRL